MQFGILERVIQASSKWFGTADSTEAAPAAHRADGDEDTADIERQRRDVDTSPFCLPPFPPC